MIASIVATASYNGVESNTRLAPTSPAAPAASTVTLKIRRGSADAASLARGYDTDGWGRFAHTVLVDMPTPAA